MTQVLNVKRKVIEYNKSVVFNNWISKNCKESKSGLNVQDLDFMFCEWKNNPKSVMFIELKQFGAKVKPGQYAQFTIVDKAFNCFSLNKTIDYRGFFVITLSEENPDTCEKITLRKLFCRHCDDYELEIDREQLRQFLNFEISFDELLHLGVI